MCKRSGGDSCHQIALHLPSPGEAGEQVLRYCCVQFGLREPVSWMRIESSVEAYRCQPGLKLFSKVIPRLREVEEDVGGGEQHGQAGHDGEQAGQQGAPPGQQKLKCLAIIC